MFKNYIDDSIKYNKPLLLSWISLHIDISKFRYSLMEFKWIIIYGTYRTTVFMITFIHKMMTDRYCESAFHILWVDKIEFYYSNFSSSVFWLGIGTYAYWQWSFSTY